MDLSRETLSGLKTDFEEFSRLSSLASPPTSPYDNKYSARSLLQKSLKHLLEASPDSGQAQWISIHMTSRIALIDHEVEELSESETSLKKTLEDIDGQSPENAGFIIIPHLVCLNQVSFWLMYSLPVLP